jgi:WD40 repeat protein
MRELLVVPAWCDPPSRPSPGLLTVDDERFRFSTSSGVVFDVPRENATLTWLRDKGIRRIPRLDLVTPDARFRLYFCRPSRSAPPGPGTSGHWAAEAVRARLRRPAEGGNDPILTITADEYRCESVAFSPDGTLLAVGKSNGMVGIWDIPAGEPIKHFLHDLMGGPVTAVTFSPDGGLLATAGRDGQLKLRNLRTGKLILRRQHPGPLQAVAFDQAAGLVATACADGAIRVWTKGGRLKSEHNAACTPSTRTIVFTESGPIPAGDEAEAQTRFSAVFTPDGSLQIRTLQTG